MVQINTATACIYGRLSGHLRFTSALPAVHCSNLAVQAKWLASKVKRRWPDTSALRQSAVSKRGTRDRQGWGGWHGSHFSFGYRLRRRMRWTRNGDWRIYVRDIRAQRSSTHPLTSPTTEATLYPWRCPLNPEPDEARATTRASLFLHTVFELFSSFRSVFCTLNHLDWHDSLHAFVQA
jgi:hypothetical protein